jgi:hypothetical protein
MCYGQTYACTITCINTDLNMSLLSDGIITGTGITRSGCRIACEAGKYIDDGGVYDPFYNTLGGISIYTLITISLIVLVALAAIVALAMRKEDDEL